MRVVVNRCFGGFGLSHAAILRYAALAGITVYPYENITVFDKNLGRERTDFNHYKPYLGGDPFMITYFLEPLGEDGVPAEDAKTFYCRDIDRTDPLLIQVVEEMGESANTRYSKLEIVDIPDGINWDIDDYDGMETIEEEHRSW